jgi:predicted nucleic acid-binding protein
MIYLDSSILLELYLDGSRAREARGILDLPETKVSSVLMIVEVPVVLRRVLHRPKEAKVLARALERFDNDLLAIGITEAMSEVALRIRSDRRFTQCRSLDAIHACTALLLREWTGFSVRVETFDSQLADLAAEFGLR